MYMRVTDREMDTAWQHIPRYAYASRGKKKLRCDDRFVALDESIRRMRTDRQTHRQTDNANGGLTIYERQNMRDNMKKSCKPRLNWPINANAIVCWSSATKSPATVRSVIYKKIKNKKVKNITLCPLAPTCVAKFPPNFAWYRAGPCHHFRSQTFLGPICSFAARGRRKFGGKRPHRRKLLIILLFIEIKQPNLVKL